MISRKYRAWVQSYLKEDEVVVWAAQVSLPKETKGIVFDYFVLSLILFFLFFSIVSESFIAVFLVFIMVFVVSSIFNFIFNYRMALYMITNNRVIVMFGFYFKSGVSHSYKPAQLKDYVVKRNRDGTANIIFSVPLYTYKKKRVKANLINISDVAQVEKLLSQLVNSGKMF